MSSDSGDGALDPVRGLSLVLLKQALESGNGLSSTPRTGLPHCDSSDCLYCQCCSDCHLHSNTLVSSLPTKRPDGDVACVDMAWAYDTSTQEEEEEEDTEQEQAACWHESHPRPWRYRESFAWRREPAPAQLVELAALGPPPASNSDMICALEWSPDGRLLATGSMAKQVCLYSMPELLDSLGEQSQSLGSMCGKDSDESVSDDTGMDTQEDEDVQEQFNPWQHAHQSSTRRGAWSNTVALSSASQGASTQKSTQALYAPAAIQRLPSKVSCLAWSPTLAGVVSVGDYDGVITQLHVASGHQLADVDAHAGRRIWGLAYSSHAPHLCASVSDDGTARLWSGPSFDTCAATITPPHGSSTRSSLWGGNSSTSASLCGVDWCPGAPHLLALACADHCAYLYDIRSTAQPLRVLTHHTRPVSYVKFLGVNQLVSASTDGSLAIWDLSGTTSSNPWSNQHPFIPDPVFSHVTQSEPGNQPYFVQKAPSVPVHRASSGFGGKGVEGMPTARRASPLGLGSGLPDGNASLWVNTAAPTLGRTRAATAAAREGGDFHGHLQAASPAPKTPADLHVHVQLKTQQEAKGPWRVLQGHKNEKNFVGLAVRAEDGLIACGSESPHVFAYQRSWATPLASLELGRRTGGTAAGGHGDGAGGLWRGPGRMGLEAICSAVAWQSAAAGVSMGLPPLLAAGTSLGGVQLLALVHPKSDKGI